MQSSYTFNYLKIYFWQGFSIIIGFVSMFIVTPSLSSDPSVFGIYMICISVTIFFTYADLGFIGASQKYAAEYFAMKDRKKEYEVIGFACFILLAFVTVFTIVIIYFSIFPQILIKEIGGHEATIARDLLIILALSSPLTILQRCVQIVFGIRLEDYFLQRLSVVGSILKIVSTFFFFREGRYLIVEYFLFCQVTSAVIAGISFFLAKHRYGYDLLALLSKVRFSSEYLKVTKKLAFSNILLTVSWIIYYESDNFVIGNLLGAEKVAVFSIGLSLLNLCRAVFGAIYSPFLNRFNHFIGQGLHENLKALYLRVIVLTAPFILWTIVSLEILMRPFILSWVGIHYEPSIVIAQFLILSNLLAFFSYPAGALLYAQERTKIMNTAGITMPVVYWAGIALTYRFVGVEAFGMFKFIVFTIFGITYAVVSIRFLEISATELLKKLVWPNAIPLAILVAGLLVLKGHLPQSKDKMNLFIVISSGVSVAGTTFLSVFLFNRDFKEYGLRVFREIRQRRALPASVIR